MHKLSRVSPLEDTLVRAVVHTARARLIPSDVSVTTGFFRRFIHHLVSHRFPPLRIVILNEVKFLEVGWLNYSVDTAPRVM